MTERPPEGRNGPAFDAGSLPPLRQIIAEHGLGARRALGQNFLLDLNVTRRIVRLAGDLDGTAVIEVGPGPGGLTRALLESPAARVVAVERDVRFLPALEALRRAAHGRLEIVEGDALEIDVSRLGEPPRAVVANLPYNVGTPLLLAWLRRIEAFRSLTLMFQKEVADRLVARPATKAYGRLSVMSQWRAEVRPLMTLPARAFTPPPKVESTVVHLTPRTGPEPAEWSAMEAVAAAAFGQRRKMLRQSLRRLGDAGALIAAAGLDPTARAEAIDVPGFAALARAYAERGGIGTDQRSD